MNGDGEFKVYACSHDVPIIKDEGLEFICDYIKKNNVRNVLEIGTAIGYSAIKFAQVSPLVNVVSLEIDIDRYIVAVQSVKDAALSDRIKLFHADALTFDFPDELKETKFDLIFIDAAKAQYIKFFEKYKTCLSENGAIISDNLSFH
ncbi:MAG: class I SAM-dependent methyltransferase [Treponema sp.]|nr:class I SAM-dependent methyltransferase [Treponema sp.]